MNLLEYYLFRQNQMFTALFFKTFWSPVCLYLGYRLWDLTLYRSYTTVLWCCAPWSFFFSKPFSSDTFLSLSMQFRFPFRPQLREAKPHDPETQPPDPAQPFGSARTRGRSTWSNARSAWSGTSSGQSDGDWPSCTSSLPVCTSWEPAESSQPALWPPSTALPPRRQVQLCWGVWTEQEHCVLMSLSVFYIWVRQRQTSNPLDCNYLLCSVLSSSHRVYSKKKKMSSKETWTFFCPSQTQADFYFVA